MEKVQGVTQAQGGNIKNKSKQKNICRSRTGYAIKAKKNPPKKPKRPKCQKTFRVTWRILEVKWEGQSAV